MKDVPASEPASLAWPLLLLLIVSLAFMQPAIPLLGFKAVPTDLLFLALLAVWAVDLAPGRIRPTWHRGYWFLLFYFAAMLVSAAAAGMPMRSIAKLSTQVYLLSLPILVGSLVQSEQRLRQALLAWLAGGALVTLVCAISLIVLTVDPHNALLAYTKSGFGSLPPGDYPRLRLTFVNANMLCNYLTVCLIILLLAWQRGWIARLLFLLLLAGLLLSAAFTISPGFGGIALALGFWAWLVLNKDRPIAARLSLALGLAVAAAFVAAAAVTPFGRPGDPVLLSLPWTSIELAPAVRSFIWADALSNSLADPLFGRGIGSDPVAVHYRVPSGEYQTLTDAHNVYLSIGVQCGILGLAALVSLLLFVGRNSFSRGAHSRLVPLGLGFAFLNALAYQGLTGSFEDARHLWVLFGLFVASLDLEARTDAPT